MASAKKESEVYAFGIIKGIKYKMKPFKAAHQNHIPDADRHTTQDRVQHMGQTQNMWQSQPVFKNVQYQICADTPSC